MDVNRNKNSLNIKSLDIAINNESDLLHPCAHEFWENEEIRNNPLQFLVSWSKTPKVYAKRVTQHKMKQNML